MASTACSAERLPLNLSGAITTFMNQKPRGTMIKQNTNNKVPRILTIVEAAIHRDTNGPSLSWCRRTPGIHPTTRLSSNRHPLLHFANP